MGCGFGYCWLLFGALAGGGTRNGGFCRDAWVLLVLGLGGLGKLVLWFFAGVTVDVCIGSVFCVVTEHGNCVCVHSLVCSVCGTEFFGLMVWSSNDIYFKDYMVWILNKAGYLCIK